MAGSSLLQAEQDHAQTHIALLKIGDSSHDLLIGSGVARSLQLLGQLCQLPGVGGIVVDHVLHQCLQLLHGSMLAVTLAGAAVVVIVVMMLMIMVMVAVMMLVIVVMITVVMVMMMLVIVMHRDFLLVRFSIL